MRFTFTERQVKVMALFVEQLVKSGVKFRVENGVDMWTVVIEPFENGRH